MSTPEQPPKSEPTFDPTDFNFRAIEPLLWSSFSATARGIHELLDRYAPVDGAFQELSSGASHQELYSDFSRVVRAQRLPPQYSAQITGARRRRRTSMTGLRVVSGGIEVNSVSRGSSYIKAHRVLGPGERCILRDDESHFVTSKTGAEVLQVVPGRHHGRSLLLPAGDGKAVNAERFRAMVRYRARLALAFRSAARTGHVSAFSAAVARSRNSLGVRLPGLRAGERRRLMFVHAHPDDESSKGAATMAELVAQGHRVMVVTCTGGEQGSILNPDAEYLADTDISELRRVEMARAVSHLGVEHRWLGYIDSGMPDDGAIEPGTFVTQTDQATRDLVGVIREFRPHVLVTYDEMGGYPHPDHITTHQVSLAAVDGAAEQAHPDLGEPWTVSKVYYHVSVDRKVVQAAHWAMLARGRRSLFGQALDLWRANPELDPAHRVTTRVMAGRRSARAARRALLSHESQVSADCLGLLLPSSLRRMEGYQRVKPPPRPRETETSLLAGLSQSERRTRSRILRRKQGGSSY